MFEGEASEGLDERRDDPRLHGHRFRVAEKVVMLFFALEWFGSIVAPLSDAARFKVWGLALISVGIVAVLKNSSRNESATFWRTLRDWFPCAIIPIAYRASGVFFRPDSQHRLDQIFITWDNDLLGNSMVSSIIHGTSGWLSPLVEISYFLCYPLVPLALLALVLSRKSRNFGKARSAEAAAGPDPVDYFWTVVLLAVLASYLIYPFFPLTPPRVLFPGSTWLMGPSRLRTLNLWMLRQNGDQASLFPSGHVAGVMAAALVVGHYLPRWGWLFIAAATAVTVATVIGRYHYFADALAGLLMAWLARRLADRLTGRSVSKERARMN